MKNMYKDFFYFDIETTSKYENVDDMKTKDPQGYYLFTKKQKNALEYNENWDIPIDELYENKAPLFPEFGKIICMSFGVYKDDKIEIRTIMDDDEEKLLNRISSVFDRVSTTGKRLCGFGIKNFDIPWVARKMMKYDIKIPRSIDFSGLKPWEVGVTDLHELWKGGSRYGATLAEVAYELGIESPKKLMSGENVFYHYWVKKDKTSISTYCESDVRCIMQVAEKLKI